MELIIMDGPLQNMHRTLRIRVDALSNEWERHPIVAATGQAGPNARSVRFRIERPEPDIARWTAANTALEQYCGRCLSEIARWSGFHLRKMEGQTVLFEIAQHHMHVWPEGRPDEAVAIYDQELDLTGHERLERMAEVFEGFLEIRNLHGEGHDTLQLPGA